MKRWLSFCLGLLPVVALLLAPQWAGAALGRYIVLENNVGYLHIAGTDKGLMDGIPAALIRLESTNSIAGIVVDLRFAAGNDTGDLPAIERALQQTKLPLAILINGQTAGASEKLAEDLREENTGLVFGSAAANFQPDIPVRANADDEKGFLKDPYAAPTLGVSTIDLNTNLLSYVDIDHTTEADLVREKIKDGDQDAATDHPSTLAMPFIRDPVLARGVDFIKGVAALRLAANQP
ncbi:MAG TPA: hypothetical protein VH280_02700 [Verrucomicrobiae bacterium]|nr:hypothetical protein [Verrucomicrobiae bacterium]